MGKTSKSLLDKTLGRRQFVSTLALAAASSQCASSESRYPGGQGHQLDTRSADEKLETYRYGALLDRARTPIHQLNGMITPSDLHFERNHSGIPEIHPDNYQLLIHGLVDRPLKFSLAELKRFPCISRIGFIECSGNCKAYFDHGPDTSAQVVAGLTSQSEWTGVSLATLLNETGLRTNAKWLLAEGGDAALMTRSIPIQKALEDAIICYAQNGEAIRPAQGYPVRLFLPGWEGSCNIKWLRRIEVGDQPWMTREETSKYTEPLLGNKARQFSFVMDAHSIITSPTCPQQIEKGWQEIRGLAWSGRGHISKVEVSTDGGSNWQPARLHPPVLDKAHTRFSLPWQWQGKEALMMSRALDSTGYWQPDATTLIKARGIDSLIYHNNAIIGWRIHGDGRITYEAFV